MVPRFLSWWEEQRSGAGSLPSLGPGQGGSDCTHLRELQGPAPSWDVHRASYIVDASMVLHE